MKVALLFAVCFVLATAHPLVKIPYSPCKVDTSCDDASYDLQNLSMSFLPNPPEKGKNVVINASGTLTKPVSGGSIKVVAKYDIVTILDESYDVCDLVQQIGKSCPLAAGPLSGSVTIQVPDDVPGGKYSVEIIGTDSDNGKLVCGSGSCDI